MKFSAVFAFSTLAMGALAAPAKGSGKVKQTIEEVETTVLGTRDVLDVSGLLPTAIPEISQFSEQAKPVAKIMKKLLAEVKTHTGTIKSSIAGLPIADEATSKLESKLKATTSKVDIRDVEDQIEKEVKGTKLGEELEKELEQVEDKLEDRDLTIATTKKTVQVAFHKIVTAVSSATSEISELETVSMVEGDVVGIAAMAVELVLEIADTLMGVCDFVGASVFEVLGVVLPLVVNVVTSLLAVVEDVVGGVVEIVSNVLGLVMPEVGSVLVGLGQAMQTMF